MTGRPTVKQLVLASRAVVATNHPLASTAGLQMIAQGGTVAAAAVAAAFVLSVVEPMMVRPSRPASGC